MINPVVILHREDLPRAYRSTPIEHVTVACLPRPDSSFQANDRIAQLILFVDHQDGNGQIKVLKSRRLGYIRRAVAMASSGRRVIGALIWALPPHRSRVSFRQSTSRSRARC